MPTAWLRPREDVELFKALTLQRGDVVECHVLDDQSQPQGSILIEVSHMGSRTSAGCWFVGRHITASDPYYRWWLAEGSGQAFVNDCWFHVCSSGKPGQCPVKRAGDAPVVHVLDLRHVMLADIVEAKIHWFADEEVVADLELYTQKAAATQLVAAVGGRSSRGPKDAGARDAAGTDWDSDPFRHEEWTQGALGSELEQLQQQLVDPRGEAVRGRGQGPLGVGNEPAQSAIRKKKREREPSPGAVVEDEDSDLDPGAAGSKRVDRGPFGCGPGLEIPASKNKKRVKPGETLDSGSDDESVFQSASSSGNLGSRHLKLLDYSQKYPGRLASRLQHRMARVVQSGGGASTYTGSTPAAALGYYQMVLKPSYASQQHHGRSLRELKTLCLALDLLTRGDRRAAADLLCQRVKAVERSLHDGSWTGAQYLELIAPDNAGLLDRDEELMLVKELELENKARAWASHAQRGTIPSSSQGSSVGFPPQQTQTWQGQRQQKGGRHFKGKGGKGTFPPPPPQAPQEQRQGQQRQN
jgi:hypothetical protein